MGRYAIFLVFSLTFSVFAYNYGINNTGWGSESRKAEIFNAGQAKNVAQSMAQVAVAKILDTDDSQFNPPANTTLYFPSDGTSWNSWNDVAGKYRLRIRNEGDSLIVVQSMGAIGDEEYQVQVQFEFAGGSSKWNPNIPTAVFAENGFELTGSARILGSAGTNSIEAGAIKLNSWSWPNSVDGDVFVGPGGDPDVVITSSNPNSIGGSKEVLSTKRDYPLPEFPSYPTGSVTTTSINLKGASSLTLNPSDISGKYYPKISIKSNTTLTINTQNSDLKLHVGDLLISQGHINITGNGVVTFYVENDFELGGSSSVNSSGDVDQVFLFHKGSSELSFKGATALKGGIYSKTADIDLGGSNSIFGHIITGGNNVTISGAAQAHSRLIYAPNAFVDMKGSGQVTGAIVSDGFKGVGNIRVFYNDNFNSEIPDLNTPGGSGPGSGLVIRSWN